jgi:di/tricarboxylate transporter
MSTQLLLVLALLGAAIVMFVINKPRMDAVGLLMIVLLPFTGSVTIAETIQGFADNSIIVLAALFVVGASLVRTGVARSIGDWITRTAGGDEVRVIVLLMLATAALGPLMGSTGVTALFVPIAQRIAQSARIPPGRLMMTISVAALASGMLTLVATPVNLVVNAEMERRGITPFGFFDITPFGIPVLALAIGYMLLARRFLPDRRSQQDAAEGRPSLNTWIEQYGLAQREFRVRVTLRSPLVGRRVSELRLRERGVNLLALERTRRFATEMIRPGASTEIEAGDVLLIDSLTAEADAESMAKEFGVDLLPLNPGGRYFTDRSQEIGMVEVMLPPESSLVGETIRSAEVRTEYGLTVIGLRRGRTVLGADFAETTLRTGDTLLVIGFWRDIERMASSSGDVVVLNRPEEFQEILPAAGKAPYALLSVAVMVTLMVSGIVPNVHAALIAALMMGLFGCIDLNASYRAINWPSLVLIAGMLPFSIALQRTGAVDMAADALVGAVGEASPRVVMAALFLITAGLGLFISNTATAVLMVPLALQIGNDLGASPYPFAMIVALAASTAFMTPVSSPVNMLVVAPGNYSFGDFVKIGVPFSIVVLLVSVFLVPILLPLYPAGSG